MSLTPAEARQPRRALATAVVVPVRPPSRPLSANVKDEIRGILREWDLA